MNHYLFNYPKYKITFNFQMDQPKWSIDPSIDLSKLVDLLDQSVWDFCKFLHKKYHNQIKTQIIQRTNHNYSFTHVGVCE